MQSHLTKWKAYSLSLASYSCRTSILFSVITHSFIHREGFKLGTCERKGVTGQRIWKNYLTFILVTRVCRVTESRQQHCQYLIQAKGKCSLPQKKCPFTFQKKWKKRLKFKYESFNGSDFLKTAFMVCYRFLGSFFGWGEELY